MSDTLDDKLREIYRNCDVSNNMVNALSEDEAIAQIKQLFKDVLPPNFEKGWRIGVDYMTGEQWCKRFTKEYEETRWIKYGFEFGDRHAAFEAAKRASGIET